MCYNFSLLCASNTSNIHNSSIRSCFSQPNVVSQQIILLYIFLNKCIPLLLSREFATEGYKKIATKAQIEFATESKIEFAIECRTILSKT